MSTDTVDLLHYAEDRIGSLEAHVERFVTYVAEHPEWESLLDSEGRELLRQLRLAAADPYERIDDEDDDEDDDDDSAVIL